MAEGTQDVHIIGIDGSIDTWSKEVTQKQIEATMKQTIAQNSGMLALLKAIANDVKPSPAELKTIGSLIKSQTQVAKEAKTTAGISGQKVDASTNKQTVVMKSMLGSSNALLSQLRKSEINDQKRASIIQQLMKHGMSGGDAEAAADKTIKKDNYMKIVKSTAAGFLGIKAVMDTAKEAVSTAFRERFDMASMIRQSGLMAGLGEAQQGFISIAKTISNTGFTFGEAAEFTKVFSKAVGVKGVESTLKFANAMADPSMKHGAGLMERFSMDFEQVANMSGQYLESLRSAGQLRGKTDTQLTIGMESFMSNVQMTANVLKVSMEEAAELMQKSLSPDQAGLLATLPEEQRKAIQEGMKSMGAQGGPMQEALAARLASGSSQAFLQSDEYQNLSGSGMGLEVIKFVNEAAAKLENGGNDVFQDFMSVEMPKFADHLTEYATQSGVRIQLVADKHMAAILGAVRASAQTQVDANKGISGGLAEDKAQTQAIEQTHEATVLAEKAMTTLMPAFTENLQELTEVNRDFARQAALTLTGWGDLISSAVDLSTGIEKLATNTATGTMDVFTKDSTVGTGYKLENAQQEKERLEGLSKEDQLKMGKTMWTGKSKYEIALADAQADIDGLNEKLNVQTFMNLTEMSDQDSKTSSRSTVHVKENEIVRNRKQPLRDSLGPAKFVTDMIANKEAELAGLSEDSLKGKTKKERNEYESTLIKELRELKQYNAKMSETASEEQKKLNQENFAIQAQVLAKLITLIDELNK